LFLSTVLAILLLLLDEVMRAGKNRNKPPAEAEPGGMEMDFTDRIPTSKDRHNFQSSQCPALLPGKRGSD
jgi:hypothetical protein